MNTELIQWFSNKQATIDISVFGEECVAMKLVMETLLGKRYKLRIMGVPIFYPSYIYGDNMMVIHNNHRLEYTHKNKSNYICYHDVCDYVAMGEYLLRHVRTNSNCANLATKVLYGGKRNFPVSNLLYYIYDDFLEYL